MKKIAVLRAASLLSSSFNAEGKSQEPSPEAGECPAAQPYDPQYYSQPQSNTKDNNCNRKDGNQGQSQEDQRWIFRAKSEPNYQRYTSGADHDEHEEDEGAKVTPICGPFGYPPTKGKDYPPDVEKKG